MNKTNGISNLPKVLSQAYAAVDHGDKKRLIRISLFQTLSGFLDLIAVALVGLLSTLAMQPTLAHSPGSKIYFAIQILKINHFGLVTQLSLLGLSAVILFTARTLISVILSRAILFSLGRWAARESTSLLKKLLSQDLMSLESRDVHETLYSITYGVESMSIEFLATAANLFADFVMLTLLGLGLVLIDPFVAFTSTVIFGLIGYCLYRYMHVRANTLSQQFTNLTIMSNSKYFDMTSLFRELVTRNSRNKYLEELSQLRFKLSDALAELSFLPNVSKYLIEAVVIISALLISGIQFLINDTLHAVTTLAVFMVAGTRIAPAALRIQQGILLMLKRIGPTQKTLALMGDLASIQTLDFSKTVHNQRTDFVPSVILRDVEVRYPGALAPAVKNINLTIPPGSFVAVVGPSGSGKSTLIDAILGLKQLSAGEILISGTTPEQVHFTWPGSISYVPQDVVIKTASLKENIELGFESTVLPYMQLEEVLKISELSELLENLPDGVNTILGEGGVKLSGGERQRLGIARALYTMPSLLILDEATSSLDAETENLISTAIHNMKGTVTLIVIAHRLATVRDADLLIYLANGRIEATGTFEELRNKSSDFNAQAQLLGL